MAHTLSRMTVLPNCQWDCNKLLMIFFFYVVMASAQSDYNSGSLGDVPIPAMPAATFAETYQVMLEIEKHIPFISISPPQVQFRKQFENWLKTACTQYGLSNNTFHLAMMLLDGYMTKFTTQPVHHHLMICCCLLIAGMFDIRITANNFIAMSVPDHFI